MIRICALAFLLAAAQAAAQTAAVSSRPPLPSLKASVTVGSDLVRIGDLLDNAGAVANIAVFRAPDIGTTGAVPVTRVLDAIRAHDLLMVDTHGLTEIEVTRAGRALTSSDIEARIARTFAGRHGLGEAKNLAVTLDREVRPIRIDANSAGELTVLRANFDRRFGRFDVTVEVDGSRTPLRYTGALVEMVDVAVLARTVARGDVLRDADLVLERRPKAEGNGDTMDTLEQALGLAMRTPQRAGQPVRRADLVKPDLVKRDESVTLIFEAPGITLTMRGKALESGSEGDLVNVLNVQSKRHVQGHVSGPGRITVSAFGGLEKTAAVVADRP